MFGRGFVSSELTIPTEYEIINKINEALAEEFEIEISTLVPEANIKDTLNIDSLGLVDMVALVERMFLAKFYADLTG